MRQAILLGGLLLSIPAIPLAAEPPPSDRRAPAGAARGEAYRSRLAEQGRVTLFVTNTVRTKLPADAPDLWKPVFGLTQDLAARTRWEGRLHYRDFRSFMAREGRVTFAHTDQPYQFQADIKDGQVNRLSRAAVLAPEVSAPGTIAMSAVVSTGPVQAKSKINGGVIFANGDVTVGGEALFTMIVADGDVTLKGSMQSGFVVARGNITLRYAYRSVLIAGGKVRIQDPALKDTPPARMKNILEEGVTQPLGLEVFFELAQVGLTVEAAEKGVQVGAITDKSPLAGAGIVKGDAISAVNGATVRTPEELRRKLRDAIATRGEATLTVRRLDKAKTVRVTFPND